MKELNLKAYAKVNLSLNIIGIKKDMHLLDMVMTTVDIFDIVTIKRRKDNEITFDSNLLGVNNSAYRAAMMLRSKFDIGGVNINIKKSIPFMAGLGGSSADASAVICGLCKIFDMDENDAVIQDIALKTGSDVPYMMKGGFCRVGGTGESVRPIDTKMNLTMLVIVPKDGVSTKECFAAYDKNPDNNLADTDKIIEAVRNENLKEMSLNMYNMLESTAMALNPDIEKIITLCNSFSAVKAMMTGSGSGVIALFDNEERLNSCQKLMKSLGLYVKKVNTLNQGIEII